MTMRLVYGFCAFLLWAFFLVSSLEIADVLSTEVIAYSLAIVVAGAMAGGD